MFRYLQDVVTLEYDADKCVGCGRCGEVCPHGVFVVRASLPLTGERAKPVLPPDAPGPSAKGSERRRAEIVDRDLCMECGACARNCPVEAINVRAGVGCAQGIIRGALGIGGDCCCGPDPDGSTCGDADSNCCG